MTVEELDQDYVPVTVRRKLITMLDKVSNVDYSEEDNEYWIPLKDGWCWDISCHLIHEYGAREVIAALDSVRECDCLDCLTVLAPRQALPVLEYDE